MNLDEKLTVEPWEYDYDEEAYLEAVKNHPWSVVTAIEWENRMCAYAETRVYRDNRTGLLYLAFDTGCSCPTPFEGHTVADLTPLRSMTDWYEHAKMHRTSPDGITCGTLPTEFQTMTRRVRELLKENRA